jgi:hypothetical protein
MSGRIKVLGMALVAALALGAITASSAFAVNTTHHITVEGLKAGEEATLKSEAKNEQIFRPTTEDETKSFACKKVGVTGKVGPTQDSVTVTPEYTECTATSGGTVSSAFVEQNGCDYQFTGKTTPGNPTGGEHASVHIKNHLSPGSPCHIEIKVSAFKLKCSSVPNQEIKHAVTYVNETVPNPDHITIKATAHGFESTTTNSIACPTTSGGTEVHTNGQYTGEVTVKAANAKGNAVPISVTALATP